jgi:hypothetical protein
MIFDIDANLISWELSKSPVSHAREFGNLIIHFSKAGKPVIIEILDASNFVGQIDKLKKIKDIAPPIPAATS